MDEPRERESVVTGQNECASQEVVSLYIYIYLYLYGRYIIYILVRRWLIVLPTGRHIARNIPEYIEYRM